MFRLLRVLFWGPRNPALGEAALIRTLEEGGSGGKTRFSFNLSKRVALPGCCMSMQEEPAGQDGGYEHFV